MDFSESTKASTVSSGEVRGWWEGERSEPGDGGAGRKKKKKPRTLEIKTHCRHRRRPLAFLGQDSMEHYGS